MGRVREVSLKQVLKEQNKTYLREQTYLWKSDDKVKYIFEKEIKKLAPSHRQSCIFFRQKYRRYREGPEKSQPKKILLILYKKIPNRYFSF